MEWTLPRPGADSSPWHRLDPRFRLVAAIGVALAAFFLRTLPGAALALVGVLALVFWSRAPLAGLLTRSVSLLLFVGLLLTFLPWSTPGPGWDVGPLHFAWAGWEKALLIGLRAGVMIVVAFWLTATAPIEASLRAARSLGCPRLLVNLLLLTHRYLHLFVDELHKLRVALRVRGFRNRASGHAYRTIGRVTGSLLVRGYERAERVGQAMRCRGFTGDLPSLTVHRATWRDAAGCAWVVLVHAGLPLLADLAWRRGMA